MTEKIICHVCEKELVPGKDNYAVISTYVESMLSDSKIIYACLSKNEKESCYDYLKRTSEIDFQKNIITVKTPDGIGLLMKADRVRGKAVVERDFEYLVEYNMTDCKIIDA